MCVIAVTNAKRVAEDTVRKMFNQNSAGAGIAWREDGLVKWKKGLDLDSITELCATLPLPYVAHFRIPTEGGKRQSLCHPFPISRLAELDLEGETKGHVLFHNGHWANWRTTMLDTLIKHPNARLPGGRWSDTRGMAWAASIYGVQSLELINEKAVAFSFEDCEFFGGPWAEVEDLWVSNKSWDTTYYAHNHGYMNGRDDYYLKPMCRYAKCTVRELVEGSPFCKEHQPKRHTAPPELKGTVIDMSALDDDDDEDEKDVLDLSGLPGGGVSGVPFAQTFAQSCDLYREDKISKKQWKRARRLFIATMRARGTPEATINTEIATLLSPTRIPITH